MFVFAVVCGELGQRLLQLRSLIGNKVKRAKKDSEMMSEISTALSLSTRLTASGLRVQGLKQEVGKVDSDKEERPELTASSSQASASDSQPSQ